MKESMYVAPYLAETGSDGFGNGLTPGSYLNRHLCGYSKGFSGKYLRALLNGLDRRVAIGLARKGPSKGGRIAYYPDTLIHAIKTARGEQ